MVGPKKQDFWPRINILEGKEIKIQSMIDSLSKIGHDFRNKLSLKLNLSKNYDVVTLKIIILCWMYQISHCAKLILFNEKYFLGKIRTIFDIKNWLSKYDFSTFQWTVIHRQNFFISFLLNMLILGQKSCFLGPTSFEIPQPNWY